MITDLNMLPISSAENVGNRLSANAVLDRKFAMRDVAVFSYLDDIARFEYRTMNRFAFGPLVKMLVYRVFVILRVRCPFKICPYVVGLVSVLVIDCFRKAIVWNERRRNKPMRRVSLRHAVNAKSEVPIPGNMGAWFKKTPSTKSVTSTVFAFLHSINRSRSTIVRNFVNSFVPSDWKPKFLHLKLSIKELSLLICARQAGNESAFRPLSLSAQLDYTS